MNRLILIIYLIFGSMIYQSSLAQEGMPYNTKVGKSMRVGGDYEISEINRTASGFRVVFTSQTKGVKFNRLILDTQHIHIGLNKGDKLRLSADVMKETNDTATINQVMIFLQTQEGKTPIWLISKHQSKFDLLRQNDLLKMHSPQSDYLLL